MTSALSIVKKVFGGLCLLGVLATAVAQNNLDVDLTQLPDVSHASEPSASAPPRQQDRFELNYVNQPPMIPHSVDGYQANLNVNTCVRCHGIKGYRAARAPRISATHFVDRDGKTLDEIAPNRYFCLSCHATQSNVAPIVTNEFQPSVGFE